MHLFSQAQPGSGCVNCHGRGPVPQSSTASMRTQYSGGRDENAPHVTVELCACRGSLGSEQRGSTETHRTYVQTGSTGTGHNPRG
jgi:hypothetical protein